MLAIVQDQSKRVVLWSAKDGSQKNLLLSISGKSITALHWTPEVFRQSFVVASNTGRIYFFEIQENEHNLREWPHVSKRKVIWCGWSHTRLTLSALNGSAPLNMAMDEKLDRLYFGCAFDDSRLAVFERNGKLLENVQLPLKVESLSFCPSRGSLFCAVLAEKQLLIHEANGRERKHAKNQGLEFDSSYGRIIGAEWFQADKIAVGFASGVILVLCVVEERVDMERTKGLHNPMFLSNLCCNAQGVCAVTGGGALFVVDLTTLSPLASKIVLKETYARVVAKLNKMASLTSTTQRQSRGNLDDSREKLMRPKWNHKHGDILSVATNSGFLFAYAAHGIAGSRAGTRAVEPVSAWTVLVHPLSFPLFATCYLCMLACSSVVLSVVLRVEWPDFVRVCFGIAEVI